MTASLKTQPGKRTDVTRATGVAGEVKTKKQHIKESGLNTGIISRWEKIASVPEKIFEMVIYVSVNI